MGLLTSLTDLLTPEFYRARRMKMAYKAEAVAHARDMLKTRKHIIHEDGDFGGSQVRSDYMANNGMGALVDNDSSPLFDIQMYMTSDAIDEATYRELQRRLYVLYKTHPLVHGWIETLVDFIVGDEFQMKSCDHDPKTQEIWDKTALNMAGQWASKAWPFPIFSREHVRRTLIFGEDFLRRFTNEIDGSTCYRQIHPIWVYNPGAIYTGYAREWTPNLISSFGIQTDPEDMLRVLAYYHDPYRNGRMKAITGHGTFDWPYMVADRSWPAPPVVHTKFGDADMKRGESVLLCVIEYLVELEKILKALRKQQQIRAEIAYWDEPITEGMTPDEISELMAKTMVTDGGTNEGRGFANQSGTTGILNNLKRVYATPNLQAEDGDWAVKRLLQCVAVGLQSAYYLISADTAGDAMASIRETTFPQVRSHKSKQKFFGMQAFEQIASTAVQSAIDAGTLSATSYHKERKVSKADPGIISVSTEKCPRNTQFVGLYPMIENRDMKATTDALAGQRGMKLISKRSSQIAIGLNADEEDAQMDIERIEDPEESAALEEMMAAMRNGGSAGGNGSNGGNGSKKVENAEPHNLGKNGRTDSKAAYRRVGTKS